MKSPAFKVAFSSIIASLSLVFMIITAVFPLGTYALSCFAGLFFIATVIEFGYKWSFSVYFVVAVLSTFLATDKEAVVYFIMFFGYYPIAKGVIEGKIKRKLFQDIIKFLIFNIAVIISFYITMFFLEVSKEEYTLFGVYIPFIFLIFGNLYFIIYDKCVTRMVVLYVNKIRKKFIKNLNTKN